MVVEIIRSAVGGDIIEICTVNKYPTDFDDVVSINRDEINNGIIPELIPIDVYVSAYDCLYWLSYLGNNDPSGGKSFYAGKRSFSSVRMTLMEAEEVTEK